jgi:hypothetical protein
MAERKEPNGLGSAITFRHVQFVKGDQKFRTFSNSVTFTNIYLNIITQEQRNTTIKKPFHSVCTTGAYGPVSLDP